MFTKIIGCWINALYPQSHLKGRCVSREKELRNGEILDEQWEQESLGAPEQKHRWRGNSGKDTEYLLSLISYFI